MARIKIDITGNPIYRVSVPVRITDINYGNHLGNDSMVSIIHEARMSFLKANNYSELDIGGTSLIMGDLAVEYLNESFYGDVLEISIVAGDITRLSFDLLYLIEVKRNEKNIIIARAKTGMVCFDYTNRKLSAMPEKFRQLLTVS